MRQGRLTKVRASVQNGRDSMNGTRPRRSLKSRVTGLHIAILFSAAVWFSIFKIAGAHSIAHGVMWFTLTIIILLECYLAVSYARNTPKPEAPLDVIAD